MDINRAHRLLGHPNERYTRLTAALAKWELTGAWKACEACAKAKAKAKCVAKVTTLKATMAAERLFVDISGPYKKTPSGNKFWVMVVDDYSRKKWSFFAANKSDLATTIEPLLTLLAGFKLHVKYIRCDNAGENVKHLKGLCDQKGIQTEFTAPYTPQMNGVVERGFVTVRDSALAMMLDAGLTDEQQGKLWAEAIYTATRLSNIVVSERMEKCPDEVFYNHTPTLYPHLVEWGRVAFVTKPGQVAKLQPKADKGMVLGFADNHSGDTYRILKESTQHVVQSRNVKWMDWAGLTPEMNKEEVTDTLMETTPSNDLYDSQNKLVRISDVPHVIPFDDKELDAAIDEDADGIMLVGTHEAGRNIDAEYDAGRISDDSESVSEAGRNIQSPKIRHPRALKQLETYYNPNPMAVLDDEDKGIHTRTRQQAHYVFNASLTSDPGLPKTFRQAFESSEKVQWMEAVKKEIKAFNDRQVFRILSREKMGHGRIPLKSRWIFTHKVEQDKSIRYKARLVVKGYDQIPGVDFTESFSPVANDTAIRTMLAVSLYHDDWVIEALDVEAAFLNADIEEEVFVEIPEGFLPTDFTDQAASHETRRLNVAKLLKAAYGTVQAPRAWMKKFSDVLLEIGLVRSKTDPCLFILPGDNKSVKGIIIIYVDDCAASGTPEVVDFIKTEIAKYFGITDLGPLTKHLGVWYAHKKKGDKSYLELTMDDFIEDLIKDYERATGTVAQVAPTPGYPNKTLTKKTDDDEVVNIKDYRSLAGKLLWLVKKVAPECSNAVRELTSFMDGPAHEHWKALGRCIGYLKGSQGSYGLKLFRPNSLQIQAWVDSDYATNKDTRRSTTGFLVTVGGCLVSWQSKTQKAVTLSSTEAEFVAMSLCAAECKFVSMILDEMAGSLVAKPMQINEDNTGAIFLVNNEQVGMRTKHVDVRYHFVKEMIQRNELIVKFTRSENNFADVMTKNVKESIHSRLVPIIRDGLFLESAEHIREDVVEEADVTEEE
jgi:transposase InsO family protein